MKRNQIWQSCLTSLLVVTLTASIVAAAPPEGKGGGKGGGGDDGGTTDPPAAPVDYHLETFFVEGFSPAIYDANDHGELLYTVKTSAVNQTTINSDAENSAALLNINTGQVQYIDNLLTRETIWSQLRGGVDSAIFQPHKINNQGDIIGNVFEYISGISQPPEAFLLKRLTAEDGTLSYDPVSFGPESQVIFLNDVGEVYGAERRDGVTREFIHFSDGTRLYLDEVGLPSQVSHYGMNNNGMYCGADSQGDFVLDYYSLTVTPIGGFNFIGNTSMESINDHNVIAGGGLAYYDYKHRGKIQTRSYRIPAILDPESGMQLFDNPDRASIQSITINNQRLNGESALLATIDAYVRQIWLKLPGIDAFYAYDALNDTDLALWSTFTARGEDFTTLLTPLNTDGSVDNEAFPTIVGRIRIDDPNTGYRDYPGFWVLRPAP